jgi:hypothetical protein
MTKACIKNIRNNGGEHVICSNHLQGSKDLVEMCDIYIYEANNILTTHNFYDIVWQTYDSFKATISLSKTKNNIYHGPAVHQNIYGMMSVANALGFDYVVCTNFDTMFTSNEFQKIRDTIDTLVAEGKLAFFLQTDDPEGSVLKTVTFVCNPKFYLEYFYPIQSEDDYNKMVLKCSSPSNGLENVYYNVLKKSGVMDKIHVVKQRENEFFNESNSFTNSQAEYYAILPITGNFKDKEKSVAVYLHFSNQKDDRVANYTVREDGKILLQDTFKVNGSMWHYKPFQIKNGSKYNAHFTVTGDEGVREKEFNFNSYDDVKNNGSLEIF